MTRCDVLYFKRVVQGCDDFLDVRITRNYEVKPTGNDVDVRVDGGRRGNDLVKTRVRTADYDDHTLRGIDGQVQFPQFERSWLIGDERNQVDVWNNLRFFVDELKIRSGPGGPKSHDFRREAVIVTLFR